MHDEEHGCQREDEPEHLSREFGRLIRGRDDDAGDRRLEQRQDRERRRPQHRERQDDEDLLGEHPSSAGRRRDRRVASQSIRGRSHRSHCTHRLDFGLLERKDRMPKRDTADLVVVGAGTIGGWASVFAKELGAERVVVLEKGEAGQGASSRAAGIVRAQGGTPETVALGMWSIDFYRSHAGALRDRQRLPRARLPDPRDGRLAGAGGGRTRRDAARSRARERPVRRRGGGGAPEPDARPGRVPRRDLRARRRVRRSAAERPRVLARDAARRGSSSASGRRSSASARGTTAP